MKERKERDKLRYQENKEKRRAQMKAYKEKNKDKMSAYAKEYGKKRYKLLKLKQTQMLIEEKIGEEYYEVLKPIGNTDYKPGFILTKTTNNAQMPFFIEGAWRMMRNDEINMLINTGFLKQVESKNYN